MEQRGGWEALIELTESGRDQYAALSLIVAYAYGKPIQPVTGPDEGPIQIAYSHLEEDIQREAAKVLAERARTLALDGGDHRSAKSTDSFG